MPKTSDPTPLANEPAVIESMEVSPQKSLPTMNKMLEPLNHVSVIKLPHIENFEPLCNVSKCLCKHKSVDCDLFQFKGEGDTVIEVKIKSDIESGYVLRPKKRPYTFEKDEEEQLDEWLQKKHAKQSPPVEREIYSAARCRLFDTRMQLVRNKTNEKKIRSEVYHHERQNPSLKRLLISRIKHASFSVSHHTPTKPDLRTENRVTVEKLKANTDANMDPKRQRNITRLNYWLNRVMDQIKSNQKTTRTLSSPTHKLLTTLQWCHFADLFNTNRIYVWEVKLQNLAVMLAVTTNNVIPSVKNAVCVINIKVVMSDRLPLLAKLLRLGRLTLKTSQLAVLLLGYTNYWKVIGVMNSESDYLEKGVSVHPTSVSHPLLASKINKVYDLLDSIRSKREGENCNATETSKSAPLTPPIAIPPSTIPIPSTSPQPTVLPEKSTTKPDSPPVTVSISNIPIVIEDGFDSDNDYFIVDSERNCSPSLSGVEYMPSTSERENTEAVQLLAHEMPSLKNITPEKVAPLPRIAFVTSSLVETRPMVLSSRSITTTIPTPALPTLVAAPSRMSTMATATMLCAPPPRLTAAPSNAFIRLSPSANIEYITIHVCDCACSNQTEFSS